MHPNKTLSGFNVPEFEAGGFWGTQSLHPAWRLCQSAKRWYICCYQFTKCLRIQVVDKEVKMVEMDCHTLLQLGMSSWRARIFSLILSLLLCRFVALQRDQFNCSSSLRVRNEPVRRSIACLPFRTNCAPPRCGRASYLCCLIFASHRTHHQDPEENRLY